MTTHKSPTPNPTATAPQKVTVIRVDNGQPFIEQAQLVQNVDGSVSFLLPDGNYAGQDPQEYGARADGPATQQYQRASIDLQDGGVGGTVTFFPHPDYPVYVYLLGTGQVYPA